jgi:hypothetical protein
VAIGAILLLAFASMAIVAAIFPEDGPQASATTPQNPAAAGNPFPQLPVDPSVTVGATPAGPTSTTPVGIRGTAAPVPTTKRPSTPAGTIAGAFQLTRDYDGGFIGTVQLSNGATSNQSWQVRLVFPANVGALQAKWISGGPGDVTVTQNGQTYTFIGQQPLAAGTKIGLSFQFGKTAGDPRPRECSVNGSACSG